ncbi:MAG: HEAT repeat domain-containing protein [Magnetococcus sp. WYHC-3]
MRNFVLVMVMAACLGMVLPLQAAPPSRDTVLPLLAGRHGPPDPAALLALGPEVATTLMELAADPSLTNIFRFRALYMLRHFDTEAVGQFLEGRLAAESGAVHVRRALRVLGDLQGRSQPQRVQSQAEALLNHGDVHVRLEAARWLGRVGDAAARQRLRQHMRSVSGWERAQMLGVTSEDVP